MAFRVDRMSRETIKPSSPTPQDLRTFKLSFLDQLAIRLCVPIVLFYPSSTSSNQPRKRSPHDDLKRSLSVTLTQMYPLAGRLKDHFSIECNDQGADYIHTRIADQDMSAVLQHPQIDLLRLLLPYNPHQPPSTDQPSEDQVILAVQVNEFPCGGIAIGVCIRHVVADAATTATFLRTWAASNSSSSNPAVVTDSFVYDCTSLFPPQDIAYGFATRLSNHKQIIRKAVTKRFIIDGPKIKALREKANVGDKHPTRIEAVVAFIWAAVISAVQDRNSSIKAHEMLLTVNLRKRMNPQLPPESMGNIFHNTRARWEATKGKATIDYKVLTKNVSESIKLVKDDYVRKIYANGQFFSAIKNRFELRANMSEEVGTFATSSWCRFPLYEINFGWGKPNWIGHCLNFINTAIVMDTSDGKGVEVWVGLSEEDMDKLEHNSDFLSYCSSSQMV